MEDSKKKGIERLIEVMEILRSENGCPWDREQTLQSLKPYIIEEAFEVVEAIDEHPEKLKDELGDLLLQVVFQAQIASETELFNFTDVADGIVNKLIRRHPHVFGDSSVESSKDVIVNWNKIKKDTEEKKYLMDGIPVAMPALGLAQRFSDRASSIGFDWEKWEDALLKFEEELGELREALASGNSDEIFHEAGDLLFAASSIVRKIGVNSEEALRSSAKRFKERFNIMEEINSDIIEGNLSLEELEECWQQAKKEIAKKRA